MVHPGLLCCYHIAQFDCFAQHSGCPLGAFGVFGKPLLAGLLCAAFARLTQNMLMQVTASRFVVLLSAAVGAAVYLVGLLLLRALKKEDIMMLPKGEKMAKILEKYSLLG